MENHHYTSIDSYIDDSIAYTEDMESSTVNVVIEEKVGDNYLIELYRERRCLYDKSHRDFKNKLIKENVWFKISTCNRKTLDQYSREKRNIKDDYKSGSVCSKRKTSAFFSQLSFLDNFIKRRRTFSNVEKKKNILQIIKNSEAINSITHDKKSNNESTDESDSEQQDTIKVPQKRNISACQDVSQDKENIEQDYNRRKKRKIDESKNIDETFTNISNAILNLLESSKENTTDNVKTIDQSFTDYIRVHLENIPEPEKSARKKLIIDALTAPIHKTCTLLKHHCTREILIAKLLHHLAATLE
ncbi:uncharacterized protein LOC116852899 [Odontomachus brunneus]|uniref:uncharacterized protein LOC116852899 n=1 Tax=Odontomachus brunneus TaxID=486640 RepID=UPI0013F1B890|nr:uncharacterized protein LOC116852899 [Odontomachus brunneus]XP_032689571.1 uncharacterized protein LOC116852899 [Odontomachus brunneus]XP_032689572.1 uncharacterized protein LOC116852899 [Odontomachus brunneus]XP_032689574.1 uncharacterized protein LOC116852899 [Odontomachus brunneus]XP_032689575.1 uncharacterized protein LOC116852899 [Odontomachus brunneus]